MTIRNHFTKGARAHDWNLAKILFVLILILLIQSCHNFAHVMTAELSWHVQKLWHELIIIRHITSKFIFEKFCIISSWTHYEMGPREPVWGAEHGRKGAVLIGTSSTRWHPKAFIYNSAFHTKIRKGLKGQLWTILDFLKLNMDVRCSTMPHLWKTLQSMADVIEMNNFKHGGFWSELNTSFEPWCWELLC